MIVSIVGFGDTSFPNPVNSQGTTDRSASQEIIRHLRAFWVPCNRSKKSGTEQQSKNPPLMFLNLNLLQNLERYNKNHNIDGKAKTDPHYTA
jgi:hypothetical protein